MKKNICLLVALLVISVISFAQNATPVPGISIIVKKNPGGIAFTNKTDDAGQFTTKLGKGKYDITVSYAEALASVSSRKENKLVNKKCYLVKLEFSGDTMGITVNGKKASSIVVIDSQTGVININLDGDTTLTGVLTVTDTCKK